MTCCGNTSCGCFSNYSAKTWIVVFKNNENDEEVVVHYFEMNVTTCVEEVERIYTEMWPDRIIVSINEKT